MLEPDEPDPVHIASSIMTEIVDTTFEKIYERDMERQTIKFVVHCAHQALLKALRIHFYQHNDYIRTDQFWGSDKHLAPSSPDSWSFHQVPLMPVSKYMSPTELELNTLSLIKLQVEDKGGVLVMGDAADTETLPPGLLEDVRALIDEMIDNVPISDDEETPPSVSEISAFTLVVEGMEHYSKFKMRPQVSRLSLGPSLSSRLPRIDVPESGASRKIQSSTELTGEAMQKLPPIRWDNLVIYVLSESLT